MKKTISITARDARASANYTAEQLAQNGAVDVDITLVIDNEDGTKEHPVTDGVTVFVDKANGGYGTCGTPRDVWCSSSLLASVDKLGSEQDSKEVLDKIAGLASIQAESPHLTGASSYVEIE